MKLKTKAGIVVSIPDSMILYQEKIISKNNTRFIAHLNNGKTIDLLEQLPNIKTVFTDRTIVQQVGDPPSFQPAPAAPVIPSVGSDYMVVGVKCDDHAHEKYKGEVFFTHKTAPGLVILDKGKVKYETKMSDMYKRRD